MTNVKNLSDATYARQALLPEGLRDQLPPFAEAEAHTIRHLMDIFLSYGYDRVSPPLVEFEDSLLIGPGSAKGDNMFRLMDPDTRKVMAIRADMTTQIARIAATRMKAAPRPLRLAYAGNVLRVKGSQIRPTRQFYQAGIELVGASGVDAQIEVIRLAVTALEKIGVKNLSVDLTIAPFVPALCQDFGFDEGLTQVVRDALDARDVGALSVLEEINSEIFATILQSAGSASDAVTALQGLNLTGCAQAYVDELDALSSKLATVLPNVTVTVDPGESHGFDYKSGLGFALFSKDVHGELGRGGRYETTFADGSHDQATGFSMYLDSLMNALPEPEMPDKLYVLHSEAAEVADNYRNQGWRVIQGLTQDNNSPNEAREIAASLGCTHIHSNGEIIAL